jgi:hypothetical protein
MSATSQPATGPGTEQAASAEPPRTGPAFILAWFERYWLAVWFFVVTGARLSLLDFTQTDRFFLDGGIYLLATRTWLAGGDPFMVELHQLTFAAPPPTLLPMVPFAVLPPPIGLAMLALALVVSAVLTVRMLGLPWWWLAFPPLVECVITGNPHGLLLPLMLSGRGWLAILVKVYAVVPLAILGQLRQLFIAAVVIVITIPILPWPEFFAEFAQVAGRHSEISQYGLAPELYWLLAPFGVVSLLIIGRQKAAWMAVPALWPNLQPYYTTLAMPTRSVVAAAIIALPINQSGLFALFALAALHVTDWQRSRQRVNKHQSNGA